MTISQFIKKETSLSNYEIAKRCKSIASKQFVYAIMNEKHSVSIDRCFKIFKQLNISNDKVADFYKNFTHNDNDNEQQAE